jgi:hypothetical protein
LKRRNFPWYLVSGMILGVVIGLACSMWIAPMTYYDTSPAGLSEAYKQQYRNLIALAYRADGDLPRAEARLKLLNDPDPIQALAAQAQALQAGGQHVEEAKALAILTAALFQEARAGGMQAATSTATLPSSNAAGGTPRPTLTPLVTFTPRPTATSQPTQGSPFVLQDRQQVCDPYKQPALLIVEIYDSSGNPLAGVDVTVTWDDGQDTFVSGLFPEIDKGYADFTMDPDVVYSVQAGEGGEVVVNIQAPQCTNADGTNFWGGWKLTFKQP